MSDEAKQLTFTLQDHDLLLECVNGIKQILDKLVAAERRIDLVDGKFSALEARVKTVEDWKIKVMAIVFFIGILFGYTLNVLGIFGHVLPSWQTQPTITVQPVPVIPVVPKTEQPAKK